MLYEYFKMISLFTGGHIKTGFHLGFVISKNNSSVCEKVIEVGNLLGCVRQIIDDIKDYEEEHHEPLGDLAHSKKRLPELAFYLLASQREKDLLEKLLEEPQENLDPIRKLVFNERVVQFTQKYMNTFKSEINLQLAQLPQKYSTLLEKLADEYLSRGF